MPALGRNAPRLLSVVDHKPHATAEDHAEPLPSYNGNADDLLREPDSDPDIDSDSDDMPEIKGWNTTRPRKTIFAPRRAGTRPVVSNIHGSASSGAKATGKKASTSPSLPQAGSEGDGLHPADPFGEEAERIVFSQLGSSQKRTRTGYGKGSKKAKTSVVATTGGNPSKPAVNFRKPLGAELELGENKSKPLSLARPSAASSTESQISSSSTRPLFRPPQGVGSDAFPASTETSALSEHLGAALSSRSRSSSLTSLSVLGSDDAIEMSPAATSPCPLCGEQVSLSFKHDFEAERCRGGRMTFRLQELFCRLHKERAAKQAWQDREYPEIDWDRLHSRLLKHNQRIRNVLSGKVKSQYREKLKEKLRSGKSKTTMQSQDQDAQGVSQVGYYGTRGGELMTSHILDHFGKELRERAGSDKVISAMGVRGGVSGYVQSVLVPEMVMALVMEDADCESDEAMRIISDSTDIGDALNEVEEEKVPHFDIPSSQDMDG